MLVGEVPERCQIIDGVGLRTGAFVAGFLTAEAPPFPNAVCDRTNFALQFPVGCLTNFLPQAHLARFFLFSWTG